MAKDETSQSSGTRADLAAMIEPLRRGLLDAEARILDGCNLSMWAYIVLLALDEQPIRSQGALADSINADRTRIIDVLDKLQERNLINRRPDPLDRRVRLVSITEAGRDLRDTAQTSIQAAENRLLAVLKPADRAGFLNALRLLSAAPIRDLLSHDETD